MSLLESVLELTLSDTHATLRELWSEEPQPLEQLAVMVADAQQVLEGIEAPKADKALGLVLGARLARLVEGVGELPEDALQAVHVAVRYFAELDDGDGDLESVFGFDDDVEVFNAVAEAVGCGELVVRSVTPGPA